MTLRPFENLFRLFIIPNFWSKKWEASILSHYFNVGKIIFSGSCIFYRPLVAENCFERRIWQFVLFLTIINIFLIESWIVLLNKSGVVLIKKRTPLWWIIIFIWLQEIYLLLSISFFEIKSVNPHSKPLFLFILCWRHLRNQLYHSTTSYSITRKNKISTSKDAKVNYSASVLILSHREKNKSLSWWIMFRRNSSIN
jgi:hypothetical protein